jgi:hypothetical protein
MNQLGLYTLDGGVWSLDDQSCPDWEDAGFERYVLEFNQKCQNLVVRAVQYGVEVHQDGIPMMGDVLNEDNVYDALIRARGVTLVSDWVRVNVDMRWVDINVFSLLSRWRNSRGVVMNVLLYNTIDVQGHVLVSSSEIPEVSFY